MESFKEFLEQQEFVDFLLNEFDNVQVQQSAVKPWSAKKPEILQMWRNLRPNLPIYIDPISKSGDVGSSSYGEDGIRISGSRNFIAGVLSRLKEILAYENPHSKLRLVFRSADSKDGSFHSEKQNYVFYINVEERGKGKAGRPKSTTPQI